ncbi:MAG TPA: hypothetical protein VFP35_00370 [Candidatus Saccharimonadales bacterium]|nr:hypothetical protein [Candidatus Saccharimonadales bacterium]
MKKILELLVCFLHPIAVILIWLNLAGRRDLLAPTKILWGLLVIIPVVPFIYVLFSGDLW